MIKRRVILRYKLIKIRCPCPLYCKNWVHCYKFSNSEIGCSLDTDYIKLVFVVTTKNARNDLMLPYSISLTFQVGFLNATIRIISDKSQTYQENKSCHESSTILANIFDIRLIVLIIVVLKWFFLYLANG